MIISLSCLGLTLLLGSIYDEQLRKGVLLFIGGLFIIIVIFVLFPMLIVKVFKIKPTDPYKWKKPLQPDRPFAFGKRTTWMEVKEQSIEMISDALKIKNIKPCNWEKGIMMNGPHIFISPPIKGWILIVGIPTQLSDNKQIKEELGGYLRKLSEKLGEVNFFSMYGFVDYYIWARARDGNIIRGVGWHEFVNIWDEGEPLHEKEIGWDEEKHPSDDFIMEIARKWCIAPWDIKPSDCEPSLGLIGFLE
jgi:hypothetical protein